MERNEDEKQKVGLIIHVFVQLIERHSIIFFDFFEKSDLVKTTL